MRQPLAYMAEPFPRPIASDESGPFETMGFAGSQGQSQLASPEYVRWVQSSLNRLLGTRLAVDGIAGPATRSAVRSFQQGQGLVVDGVVGPDTEAALRAGVTGASSYPGAVPPILAPSCRRTGEQCIVVDGFDFDQDRLKPEQNARIEAIANGIGTGGASSVRLVGHTDPVGDVTYNLALGRRRAERVAEALRRRMPRIAISVDSCGENEPISQDPAQNRRVEICTPSAPPGDCVVGERKGGFAPHPRQRSTKTPVPPRYRACCMFSAQTLLGADNIVDPANLGGHRAPDEVNGILYTGKAGFLDLGHIRDSCDMTKYLFDQLTMTQGLTPRRVYARYAEGLSVGEAVMRGCPPDPILAARAMAYDVSLGHEIASYWGYRTPGAHNSSFSPEDLCSNFLGTLLAGRALAAGYDFNEAAADELNWMIFDLDGQTAAESLKAFNRVNGRWVHWIFGAIPPSVTRPAYLKRRNFTRLPWQAGHFSDKPIPAYVTASLPNESSLRALYDYTHFEDGTRRPASGYPKEILRIKQDAAKKYGVTFDQP